MYPVSFGTVKCVQLYPSKRKYWFSKSSIVTKSFAPGRLSTRSALLPNARPTGTQKFISLRWWRSYCESLCGLMVGATLGIATRIVGGDWNHTPEGSPHVGAISV